MRVRWMWLVTVMVAAFLSGCERVEYEHEVGFIGEARLNPYLAAERLLEYYGYQVTDAGKWPNFQEISSSGTIFIPLSIIQNQVQASQLEKWAERGGRVVVLVDFAESRYSDFDIGGLSTDVMPTAEESKGMALLERMGFELNHEKEKKVERITVAEKEYRIQASSLMRVNGSWWATREWGHGWIGVVADARPLRNRWIGERDHASILTGIVEQEEPGEVIFLRFASSSFWALLWERGWPFLLSLCVVIVVWLMRQLPRFGPIDHHFGEPVPLRAYDQYLGVLGDFHWRIDRGQNLLEALRRGIAERAQQLGIPENDLYPALAQRSGLNEVQVRQALSNKNLQRNEDFILTTTELQTILNSL